MQTKFRAAPILIAFLLFVSACGSDADATDIVVGREDTTTTTEVVESTTDVDKGVEEVEGVTRFWILPELIDCVGEAPQRCMQVAEAEDGEYLLFYDQIAGFEYVEGTTYVIDVLVEDVLDPPADASSLSYTLVDVISAE